MPYYHSNVDSDEMMFYCGGDYEARKGPGIGQGSISCIRAVTATARNRVRTKRYRRDSSRAGRHGRYVPSVAIGPAALASEDGRYAGSWDRALRR